MESKRSDFPCPYVVSDAMEPVRGMHNGKMYDSKSQLRKSYAAHGYREVGNDIPINDHMKHGDTPIIHRQKSSEESAIKERRDAIEKALAQVGITE